MEAAQRLAASLTFFWQLQGTYEEGAAWLKEALALSARGAAAAVCLASGTAHDVAAVAAAHQSAAMRGGSTPKR